MTRNFLKAAYVAWIGATIAIASFGLGMRCQKDWYGEARVFTNVDEHSPLNHGQKSVEITLPEGVILTEFGSCGPHWRMHHADDTISYWQSASINTERYDPNIHGFVAVPDNGQHWVEIDAP